MIRALLLVAVTLLPSVSWAADGILPGQEFRIPFAVDGTPTKKGGKATVTLGADGKGVLRVVYAKDGDVEGVSYTLIRSDSPDPTPTPTPPPTPTPTPAKAAFLYLIHESNDSTPAETAVRLDKAWKDKADALKIRWLVADKDSAAKSLPVSTAMAVKCGLPAVVYMNASGLATAVKCPETAAAMASLIDKLGGK